MSGIYIAFGANLSNPKSTFTTAIDALENRGVATLKLSGLWQSPAWPSGSKQPDYINACAHVEFEGNAREILNILHAVEAEFGRKRSVENAARKLDLDLLDFKGKTVSDNLGLKVPHPRMLSRGFVLFPLTEIAPEWVDPVHGIKIWNWIARLPLSDVEPMQRLSRSIRL